MPEKLRQIFLHIFTYREGGLSAASES